MNLPLYGPDPSRSTRFLFFTGKGGVGKTSLSCATALKLASTGKRVLLVSTDPASNLDEVLEVTLANHPTPVPGAQGLDALNINPLAAAAAYRERLIGPMRGLLPETALRSMEEQLSGSCTVEIAAFDEFSGLIGDPQAAAGYDHVIFDTAPTGHTLRLMSLAKAWDQFLDSSTSGTSCLGPLAGLDKQRAIYENTVKVLADAKSTTLVLVSRPQASALREAERTSGELRALGVANQCLVINGTFETNCPDDPTAQAMQQRGLSALNASAEFINSMPSFVVPLRSINILGIGGLRVLLEGEALSTAAACCRFPEPALLASRSQEVTNADSDAFSTAAGLPDPRAAAGLPKSKAEAIPPLESLADLVSDIEQQGHGVIMTMGKGGVGKTTVAAAIAVMLARRGHSVHLSTTDPAAHVAQTLDGQVDGLTLSRIDPAAETAAYHREVMANSRHPDGRSRPRPAGGGFAFALHRGNRRVPRLCPRGRSRHGPLCRARHRPTGHTLLLLDASEAYQRELERQARSTQPEEVLKLLERLRDPAFTRILLVTLPEATPVHEAAALQEDLRRARIEPFAWVINQSLLNSGSCDPLLQRREESEHRYLSKSWKNTPPAPHGCHGRRRSRPVPKLWRNWRHPVLRGSAPIRFFPEGKPLVAGDWAKRYSRLRSSAVPSSRQGCLRPKPHRLQIRLPVDDEHDRSPPPG